MKRLNVINDFLIDYILENKKVIEFFNREIINFNLVELSINNQFIKESSNEKEYKFLWFKFTINLEIA